MKQKQKPLSFSLHPDNIAYVMECFKVRHRNQSHWMDDLLTHLRTKSLETTKAPRSKAKTYPSNIDDCFIALWDSKGKKGSKVKAYAKFKTFVVNSNEETCSAFTKILFDDIHKNRNAVGFAELHLITYFNQERWDNE